MKRLFLTAAILASIAACAKPGQFVPGTKIPYTDSNRAVLDACETYRRAVEERNVDGLMLMVHPEYWEDSGTPSGSDDYGYEGLRNVLLTRLLKATEIRYSVRYVGVRQQCNGDLQPKCRAAVDVLIDASYTVMNAYGKPSRPDKRDQNQLVLEWDGRRWLFISGM